MHQYTVQRRSIDSKQVGYLLPTGLSFIHELVNVLELRGFQLRLATELRTARLTNHARTRV
ncbi:hypothetical protein BN2475_980004 [Paraburkholderia ribeironis]|uniref:Uncharacterized protein n=1 Tax=Paraburkholderia ribeironis TaxID=1247936 RepID=A0A1N7SM18_9BURK|nr:hypothetical protein BN2475_980004 [Paraburkholderia ribeironis]